MGKWSAVLALAAFLYAQAALAEERVEDTVVVTASRLAESSRTVTQSVTVIGSETLDKHQYESLADLLQNYGFNINTYGPSQTSTQIVIRGKSSSYSNVLDSDVLLLINGAPIATANLSMISMDGIERIEILRGAGAVQYGSNAMGGVINIIPKKGGKEFHLSAEGGGGTWNAWRGLGSLSGQYKIFDFAGSVTWNKQGDNYTTGDGDLYSDTEAKQRLGYLMNFGVNFNEENRLGAVISGANDWGLGLSQGLSAEQLYGVLGFESKHVNSNANITYDGGYSPYGLNWMLRYFNAYDQLEYMHPRNNPMHSSDYAIDVIQTGGQGQVSWNWNFLTLTAGMDYAESEYLPSSSATWTNKYKQGDTAGFGMTKLSFLDEMIVLTGGIRYDSYMYRVNGKDAYMDNTAFSAGVAFNPWDWLTLRGNYGESFKMPSGIAVIGYKGSAGSEVVGNPDLKPEKGYGWDAGLDIHWRGVNASLTYFSTLYGDKIAAGGTWPKTEYENLDGVSFYNGLESQIGVDLGDFFNWDFMLQPYFNFTRLFNFNDPDGERIPNVYDFVAGFGVNFNYPDWGTNLDVRLNYLGYQKETYCEEYYKTAGGEILSKNLGEKWTGGKTTMDIFLAQKIHEFEDGGKFTLKAEARNLTNENYAYRYDYPMPGRSFYVGARYDF